LELARNYIRVNAVSPSFIDTQSPLSPTTADYADAIQATRPWPRHGTPEDIAQAVAYLCSDEAEWITGTTLRVDGGRSTGDFKLPTTDVRPVTS
jgi:NAD(P)-dependent dehydrogenase (short-subunit alcohol dehydrogenase family)